MGEWVGGGVRRGRDVVVSAGNRPKATRMDTGFVILSTALQIRTYVDRSARRLFFIHKPRSLTIDDLFDHYVTNWTRNQ